MFIIRYYRTTKKSSTKVSKVPSSGTGNQKVKSAQFVQSDEDATSDEEELSEDEEPEN